MFPLTPMGNMMVDRRRFFKSLLITALFNTIIALFLTHLEYGAGFATNFIFSQAIGLSICTSILTGHLFLKNPTALQHFIMILITLTLGAVLGSFFGAFILGMSLAGIFQGKPVSLFQLLGIGILFGSVITYFFFSQERIAQTKAEMQEERIKRLDSEKSALETHLKMLQAQIEPHFLFNSLSTVLTLMDTDRKKAGKMLTDLIQFLRISLSKTRAETTTIGHEMEMARAYPNIYQIRMGDRLQLISVDEIRYFKSSDKYTVVRTETDEHLIRKPIRALIEELDSNCFRQIHRGCVVNVSCISGVSRSLTGKGTLRLKNIPETLSVSQTYMHLFKQM